MKRIRLLTLLFCFVTYIFVINSFDITSYADGEKYTLIFDANGGVFATDEEDDPISQKSIEIEKGESIQLGNYRPSKEGYKFLGWKKSTSTENKYFDYGTSTPDGDTTYIAGWKKICKVKIYANGGYFSKTSTIDGDIIKDTIDVEIEEGNDYYFVHPIRDGYVFMGFKKDKDDAIYDNSFTVLDDTVFYAQWAEKKTITYIDNGETYEFSYYKGQTIIIGGFYEHNTNIYNIFCHKEKKVYIGWKDLKGIIHKCHDKYVVNDNMVFTAVYKNIIKIEYKNNGGIINIPQNNYDFNICNCEGLWSIDYNDTPNPSSSSGFLETYTDYTVTSYCIEDEKIHVGVVEDNKQNNPSRRGYKFIGWRSSLDNKIYSHNEEIGINQDVSFTAVWELDKRIHEYEDGQQYYCTVTDFDESLYNMGISIVLDEDTHAYYRINSRKIKKGILIHGNVIYLSPQKKSCKKITVPDYIYIDTQRYAVSFIDDDAFINCKQLESINIGDNVGWIGSDFSKCKKLKNVILGKNVTGITNYTFMNCKSLKQITIKSEKLKTINKKPFKGINKKVTFVLPKKCYKKYKKMIKKAGAPKKAKYKKIK